MSKKKGLKLEKK